MGILWGLIAAANWGFADFCARFATVRIGNFRSFLYMQLVGLLGLSLWLLIQPPPAWDWFYVLLAAGLAAAVPAWRLARLSPSDLLNVFAHER